MNENNIAKMQMFRSIVWKIVAKTTDNMSIKKLRVILPGTLPPTIGNRSKYRFIATPPPKMLCNKVTNVLQSNYTKINVCCQISEAQDIKIIRNNGNVLTEFYGWELTISGRKTLNIGERKEILILLYSKKIIEDDDTIILYLKGMEKIYIHGNRSIESALFGGITVEVVDTNGKK